MKRRRSEKADPGPARGKRWSYATKRKDDAFVSLETENTLNVGNPPIPEPVHRVSQRSHGMSLRFREKATVQSIKETCSFFEEKCAGKYSSKGLAARYVFELSREVQQSLNDVQETINLKNERIQFLEKHVMDWEQSFGASDANPSEKQADSSPVPRRMMTLTPADVKKQLEENLQKIGELERKLERHEEEKKQLLKDSEIDVVDQFGLLREEQRADVDRIKKEYSDKLEEARKALEKQFEDRGILLKHGYNSQHLQAAAKAKNEIARLKKKLKVSIEEKESLYEQHNRSKQETARQYKSKVKSIEDNLRQEYAAEIAALELKAASVNVALREQREDFKNQLASKTAAIGEEYEDRLSNEESKCKALHTENEYLRGRIKELNKLLKAYQLAVEPA